MYKCNNCETIFEEPKEISAESFFGVSSEFGYSYGNTVSVCPYCEDNDYEEVNNEEEETNRDAEI